MIISDITDARILSALRACGSFTGAADVLRLPTTTVSRRVAKMEDRAGLRLFERTSRAVRITEAGTVAADHAIRMLSQAEAAELSIEALRDRPLGPVAISTPVIFGQAILAPVATGFLRAYPDCTLEIDLSDRHIDLVEDRFDAVVRIGPPESDEIIAKPLGVVFAGLYCSVKADVPKTIDELSGLPLGLLHPGLSQTPELRLTSSAGEERRLPVSPQLITMNPWLLREAALDGDMIVVLPDMVAKPAIEAGRLTRVLPDWSARRAPVHLAFTSRRLMRPAVRAFIDHAAKAIPPRLKA